MGRGGHPVALTFAATSAVGALYLVVVGVVTAIVRQRTPPTCEGIGWGCTPSWQTGMTIVAVLVVGVVIAATAIVAAVGLARIAVGPERASCWQQRVSHVVFAAVAFLAVLSLALAGW